MTDKELREISKELYKPPFKYINGYIFDSESHVMLDKGGCDSIARIRGWGRIQYIEADGDAGKLQDTVGHLIAELLTKYWGE